MFKTLEITNFKSIGHAVFDLGKINVLTGQSNLGKSNVVQALYCLTHNHWDSNYLKWGTKKCAIKLTDDLGNWVEYRHNETSAEYSLSSVAQPFTKIGRDVPADVKSFLKMSEVQFDEDLLLDFNFERQFDPSFVISLSGFELAKVFGKIMNLDIVLSASRNINKDLAAIKKAVDGQTAIEEVSIDYIQKNYPIELKYALLHTAIDIDSKADSLDTKNASLLNFLTELDYYNNCVKVYSDFLQSDTAKQIDAVREPIQGLDTVIVSFMVAQEAQKAYYAAIRDKVPEFDFDSFYGLLNSIVGVSVSSEKATVYKNAVEKCDSVSSDLIELVTKTGSVMDSLSQWEVEVMTETSALSQKETEVNITMDAFNKFLTENNICPISGKPFEEGCISSIMASV